MTTLIDDYLREVETSLRTDTRRKRHIIDELRSHLADKVDDLQRAQPDRPRADLEREVLHEFGSARDLALGYEAEGTPVLRNEAGEIVLRLGKAVGRGAAAVGRGTGRVLKWMAISLAALLVLAVGVGAWAFYEVKPYIPAIIESQEPVYRYHERCVDTPCSGAAPGDVFYVRPEVKTVRFDLNLHATRSVEDWETPLGNGTVHVSVSDPNGTLRFDRTFNVSSEGGLKQEMSWAATPGNWTVQYRFDGFQGTLDVATYAVAFPWRDE